MAAPIFMPATFEKGLLPKEQQRKFEQPWHRTAAYLVASGVKPKVIAELVDKDISGVHDLMRTEWFQVEVAAAIETAGGKDLIELFKKQCLAALTVECQLLESEKTPPAVRAGIARTQIERVYGKAMQRIEVDNVTKSDNPVEEVAQLEREVERLSKARLGGLS